MTRKCIFHIENIESSSKVIKIDIDRKTVHRTVLEAESSVRKRHESKRRDVLAYPSTFSHSY